MIYVEDANGQLWLAEPEHLHKPKRCQHAIVLPHPGGGSWPYIVCTKEEGHTGPHHVPDDRWIDVSISRPRTLGVMSQPNVATIEETITRTVTFKEGEA